VLEPTSFDAGATGTAGVSSADEPAAALVCVVCGGPSEQPEGCCSLTCARRAEHELRANTGRIRRVNGDPGAADLRRAIAERNGRLTSALLRWRPRPAGEPSSERPAERCPGPAAVAGVAATPAATPAATVPETPVPR
jgi:hypothetical protein